MNNPAKIRIFRITVLSAMLAMTAGFGLAQAQSQPAPAASAAASGKLLGLGEIEARLATQGIKIKEIEVRDKVLEVEGYDAQGRKIELIVDRRTAEILSHRFDD